MAVPLSLKGFSYAVDHIPDSYWDKIPIYKPKEKAEDKIDEVDNREHKSRSNKARRNSYDSRNDYEPSDSRKSRRSPKNSRSNQERDRQRHRNHSPDSQDSNNQRSEVAPAAAAGGAEAGVYGEPDPRYNTQRDLYGNDRDFWQQQDRIESPPNMSDQYNYPSPQQRNNYTPNYSPQDYQQPNAPQASSTNGGYNPHAYIPAQYQQKQQQQQQQPQQQPQQQQQQRQSKQQGYQNEPYGRPASANDVGRRRRNDRYDNDDEDEDDRSDSSDDHSRRRSGKKDRMTKRLERSPPGVRGRLSKNLDVSEKGVKYSALGAIAGGFIGHEMGKGPLSTVAGVLLGGLGANVLEARKERHKMDERRERKYSEIKAMERAHGEGQRNSSHEGERRGQYADNGQKTRDGGYNDRSNDPDNSDDDESDDESRRRRRRRNRSRSSRQDR